MEQYQIKLLLTGPFRFPSPGVVKGSEHLELAQLTHRATTGGGWSPRRRAGKSPSRAETVSTTRERFPELVKAIAELDAPSLVLDGEIAIFDRQLISRFEWLRARPKHEVATPPMYMVFDLLALKGEDLRPRSLLERRQALEQLAARPDVPWRDAMTVSTALGTTLCTSSWQA